MVVVLTTEDIFNHIHDILRNMIEGAFEVLKARFPILKRMAPYFRTRRDIFITCVAIQNFLWKITVIDSLFEQFEREVLL